MLLVEKPFYLATAIAYVNGAPHIGHALEYIQADAICRMKRQAGMATHFVTGTDEHGKKIADTAAAAGLSPKELVDENAKHFRALKDTFALSYDDFIQTTDTTRHYPACQKMWRILQKNGYLEKRSYTASYCVGCESFKQPHELEEGKCPAHNAPLEEVSEENWFFKLSAFSDKILHALESGELAIYPKSRAAEIISLCKKGLEDVSFSRPKEKVSWGIPVPDDEDHVMYVWCDALMNYLSATGYAETDAPPLWPCDLHVIGKDIVRFHAGIWPGMLLAAGMPLPKGIFVHGFVTSEGKKMSKSLGNVVDPVHIAKTYGTDALRWYLLSQMPVGDDGDFSHGRFLEVYKSELMNTFGNLISRLTALAAPFSPLKATPLPPKLAELSSSAFAARAAALKHFDTKAAAESALQLARNINGFLEETQPWKLKKEEKPKALAPLLEITRSAAFLMLPFIPHSAAAAFTALGADAESSTYPLPPARSFSPVKHAPLFPPIEEGA